MKSSRLVTCAVVTAVNCILCTSAAFIMGAIPGLPLGFCPAIPVMIPFAIWFGGWGVLGAFIGCAIGGVLKGTAITVALPWVVNDIFMTGIPLLAFRILKANPMLETKRDWTIFIAFGLVINSVLACAWGTMIPVYFNVWPSGAVPMIYIQYLIMALILIGTLVPLILKKFTPHVQRMGLMVEGYL